MDDVTKDAIHAASEQAAQDAVEAIKPYFDSKVQEVKRHMDVRAEALEEKVAGVADLVQRDDEKTENHRKRIGRLEDHAGLPILASATE